VTEKSVVSQTDTEPRAKRQCPARRSSSIRCTDSSPQSDSEYDPSDNFKEAGSTKSSRKSGRRCGRGRGPKIQDIKVEQHEKTKIDGPLVSVNDGMAIMHLPPEALRALSQDDLGNGFRTPTRQVINHYQSPETEGDQVSSA